MRHKRSNFFKENTPDTWGVSGYELGRDQVKAGMKK